MLDQTRSPDHAPDPYASTAGRDATASIPDRLNGSHRGLAELDPWVTEIPDIDKRLIDRERRRRLLRGMTEVLEVVALALIMFMGVRMVVHNYVVDGDSMLPTFENDQLVIVNRLAYSSFDLSWIPGVDNDEWRPLGAPDRGDIIVFTYDQNRPRDFIKRVIAMPGDRIEVRDGYVYLNNEQLDEPYAHALANQDFGPETVPDGHLFVMGDNRNNSWDSRGFGSIEADQVIGRAELRYWPMGELKLIDHNLGSSMLILPSLGSVVADRVLPDWEVPSFLTPW